MRWSSKGGNYRSGHAPRRSLGNELRSEATTLTPSMTARKVSFVLREVDFMSLGLATPSTSRADCARTGGIQGVACVAASVRRTNTLTPIKKAVVKSITIHTSTGRPQTKRYGRPISA